MENHGESKKEGAICFFLIKGIAISILLSWLFQLGYEHQLEYNLNQDFLSRYDREDLGFFWFLILVARLSDLAFSIGFTFEMLSEKSKETLWLSLAIVCLAGVISFPWLIADHPQELGWFSLKASFFLRFVVTAGTVVFLIRKDDSLPST
ncbi:MAG: hypothetical protein HGB37_04095 [Candidatus Moranbacteria bacterium]|nr:hypothetical protein [Candidatus Moranbacteria bacterium]